MAYIRRSLDEPFSIAELATAVGMTRQRLQLGFRVVTAIRSAAFATR